MSNNGHPTVLYVAGHGRSGSTLLGMMLGATSGSLFCGELAVIFNRWLDGRQVCSCGEIMNDCLVWRAVMTDFRRRMPHTDLAEAAQITDQLERLGGPWPLGRPTHEQLGSYARLWGAMFASITAITGSGTIIDSSKSAHPRARRPSLLMQSGADVRVLILIRDPRAVMWSVEAAGRRKRDRKPFRAERTLASWITTYASALRLLNSADIPSAIVRYEDLTTQPRAALQRAERELGIDFSEAVAAAEKQRNVAPEHAFAGNAIRRNSVTIVRPARPDWSNQLSEPLQALAMLGSPLMRRYGYHRKLSER